MEFAYADPPYLGCGKVHYGEHHPNAALWDDPSAHLDLAAHLADEYPDGWALSLNPRDLSMYLPALPDDVRVAAWCKTWHQIRPTTVQFAWEPVIFRGGRKEPRRTPMVRDYLVCATERRGIIGAKPQKFNQWVLDLLAFDPSEDTIVDLFPGSDSMAHTLDRPPLDFGVPSGR